MEVSEMPTHLAPQHQFAFGVRITIAVSLKC